MTMKALLNRPRRRRATLAAAVAAGLFLALAAPRGAEATFPGADGRIAFASNRTTGEGVDNPTGDYEIFTMQPDGTDVVQLTHNTDFDFDPEWSPDGRKIAFESDRDQFSEIFVMKADGTKQTKITTNPDFSFDRSPTFSPDGDKIAFESNRVAGEGVDNPEADVEIFVQNLDGTDLEQLTHNGTREFDRQPDFSPDGKKIAFVSNRQDDLPGIYTMNADGTGERRRSRGPATVFESPSWSPKGGRISFMSNQGGPDEIYKMRRDGSGQRRLTDNGAPRDASPVFSPEGGRIAFNSNRDGNFEVYVVNRSGTEPLNLTDDPAGDFTPDWQPLKKRY